jgi:hypothetical protein
MRRAALRRVDELERDGRIVSDDALRLRRYVNRRKPSADGGPNHEVVRELVNVERETLIAARERGVIDNTVLRRMQASLDMEELQIDHHLGSPDGERRA